MPLVPGTTGITPALTNRVAGAVHPLTRTPASPDGRAVAFTPVNGSDATTHPPGRTTRTGV